MIGGGAIGLSVAFHLTRRGFGDVLLVERHQLTSGTSWHAAGIVGPLRATPNMTRLAMYAGELFPRLEHETGMATGYRQTGGYWLAREPERMDELRRIAALGRHFGLGVHETDADSVARAWPALATDGIVGALSVSEDATVNPVDLCMAYAGAARAAGATIREHATVNHITRHGNRVTGVVLEDGTAVTAPRVALCAGAWSCRLAEPVGVALPLQAVEHMYVVTDPDPGFDGFPVVRDLDRGIYIKGDAGRLVVGGFEPDAKIFATQGPGADTPFVELPEDWQQFEPFIDAAVTLVPRLADVGIQHFMNGPESFTTDTRPLVGESPEVDGLFVAAGMNSVGVMSSAGVGRVLADWMADGRAPMDLWEIDIARVDPLTASESHRHARMREAVADQFAMHWPYKQPAAGRGLRRSALHDQWAAAGAVFGLTAGWERGLWYAREERERHLPYSVGEQAWYDIAAREVAQLDSGAVLIDLSPFAKFEITGENAVTGLDWLSTASLDVPDGRAVYTQFLNARGGIEADVTVTRLGPRRFRVISAAASRWRDLAYLRRNLPTGVTVRDYTEEACVIGIMGAGARDVLGQALDGSRLPALFRSDAVTIAGVDARATRLSFVGEFGLEIEVDNADADAVFTALRQLGATPMGHFAVDSCRLEKGYRHWGHDIGPELNPLEAGLGFTVDRSKRAIASDALATASSTRRLCLCAVEGAPLILHDEPVWQRGQVVGLTTSGGRGMRTGLTLAFVLFDRGASWTAHEPLSIEVAGKRHEARILSRAPFDPDNRRMH